MCQKIVAAGNFVSKRNKKAKNRGPADVGSVSGEKKKKSAVIGLFLNQERRDFTAQKS